MTSHYSLTEYPHLSDVTLWHYSPAEYPHLSDVTLQSDRISSPEWRQTTVWPNILTWGKSHYSLAEHPHLSDVTVQSDRTSSPEWRHTTDWLIILTWVTSHYRLVNYPHLSDVTVQSDLISSPEWRHRAVRPPGLFHFLSDWPSSCTPGTLISVPVCYCYQGRYLLSMKSTYYKWRVAVVNHSNSSLGILLQILKLHRSFVKLDADPQWDKQLDPDPQKMNADLQPWPSKQYSRLRKDLFYLLRYRYSRNLRFLIIGETTFSRRPWYPPPQDWRWSWGWRHRGSGWQGGPAAASACSHPAHS